MLGHSAQPRAGGPLVHWRGLTRTHARHLVIAGIMMFGLYVAMDLIASLAYDGYSYRDQTISELSAVGAPTRAFWLTGSVLYGALAFAFAFGVLGSDAGRWQVRVVGWLLLVFAVVNLLWWIAPMHRREVLEAGGGNWQDTMHLVVGGVSSILFFAMIAVGAFAFGRRFRWYSFGTFVAVLLFGALMGTQTGAVGDNEPTPWLGIYERIAIEGSMLWMAVFAAALLLDPEGRRRSRR